MLPQNVAEFYAAATSARRVSEPKTSTEAAEAIHKFLALPGLSLLPVPTDVVVRLLALLARRPVTGVKVHDLHLVAGMLGNGITTIYTFNADDFAPFSELTVLIPDHA